MRTSVKVAVSLGLAAVLLAFLGGHGIEEMMAAIRGAEPGWVAVAAAASVLGVLISAGRWWGLMRSGGLDVPLAAAARVYWIAMFCGNLLPTSIGGDAVRLALTPASGRRVQVAGSILVERLTGLAVLLGLCALGLLVRPPRLEGAPASLALALASLGGAAAAVGLVAAPGPLARVLALAAGRAPAAARKPVALVADVAAAVHRQARDGAAIARALLFSVPFYASIMLAQYAVLRAVGAAVPAADVASLSLLVPLVSLLPVSLNGIGVAEGAFVLLYVGAGAPPEAALAAAVLHRVVVLAVSMLGGFWWAAASPSGRGPSDTHEVGGPPSPAARPGMPLARPAGFLAPLLPRDLRAGRVNDYRGLPREEALERDVAVGPA